MAIPESFKQELLARIDLVELIGRYVPLKRGGANFMGLCPFHDEKSPSFTVSPTKQFFHCFGCGQHGNAIGFLMEHQGLHYVEAVKDLAQQVGMQVPDDGSSPQDRARMAQQRKLQSSLTELLEKAAKAYQAELKRSPRAVEYLKGRGLTGQIAKHYGLGYAPPGYHFLSTIFPDYTDVLLTESGQVIHHSEEETGKEERYDRFRDRVMFPIRNVKGECIGFGGRVLTDEKPKYLNTSETPVFSKGRELYGLFEARQTIRNLGYVLVTEGYMDVVALAQLGFGNAVATLGTACTADHVHKLFQFSDSVVFSFDGDAAGRRAARKALDAALPYATDVRSVKFLFLPAEHDPDSYIRAFGSEAFAEQVAKAMPLSQFLLEAAAHECDLDTFEGRSRLATQAKPLWQPLPDGALKRQLLAELSERVQLGSRELLELWGEVSNAPPKRTPRGSSPSAFGREESYISNSKVFNTGRGMGAQWSTSPSTKRGREAVAPLRRGARQVVAREDVAARLLLAHASAWESLSNEEHSLLCGLPSPHGPLFTWIDHQHHEHGPQPWGHLSEQLHGLPFSDLAHRVMSLPGAKSEWQDAQHELKDVMGRLLRDQLGSEKAHLLELLSQDPDNADHKARFRKVSDRWSALTVSLSSANSPAADGKQ